MDEVTIRFAETEEDREQVFRFRYQIYFEEMNLDSDEVDHERERLTNHNDDHARLLIGETADGQIVGTLRIHWGGDAAFNEGLARVYDTDRFAAVVGPDQMVIFDRFMVRPAYRGTFVPLQFLARIAEFALEQRTRLTFCDCAPHLLNLYTSMGFRTYTRTYNDPMWGLLVPLVLVVEDREHLERIGSPLLGFEARKQYDPRPPSDILDLLPTSGAIQTMSAEGAAAWAHAAADEGAGATILDELGGDDLAAVVERSFVIILEDGDRIIQQDATDRTMFIVLSGQLEVRSRGRTVAALGRGHVFGELAFLLHRDRTADVVAVGSDVRVLSLNEKAVTDLIEDQPAVAARFFRNLARVVSTKLVDLHRIGAAQVELSVQ